MTLLDDLRAADAAMTPGPWTNDARWVYLDGLSIVETAYHQGTDDAAGIALMRNALPKLLAVVEAAPELADIIDSLLAPPIDGNGLHRGRGYPTGSAATRWDGGQQWRSEDERIDAAQARLRAAIAALEDGS